MATFWRYIKIQLMIFVFGIVGPIFLAIYFATQPDPSMKWAYWAGLFITAADVLIALAITNASDPNKAPRAGRHATTRGQSVSGGQSSSFDPFLSSALTFSTDSGSSSNDYSSNDYSSSSDYSSSDSGSSSSGSGSSSDSGSSSSSD